MSMLSETIDTLNESEQRKVMELISALKTPISETINYDYEFFNNRSIADFKSSLMAQHLFLRSPLFMETFEAAFLSAMQAGGYDCNKAPDGARFWDIEVEGKKISLKSTKAQGLKKEKLDISKLTEAAWIQDCRTAAKREELTKHLFLEYVSTVDSILQLRYFKKQNYYELVEIPVVLFAHIQNVSRSYFDSDGPTISIPMGVNPPYMKIKLDRSDAKITIAQILNDHCTVLGLWQFN
jgi:hypothetical protein